MDYAKLDDGVWQEKSASRMTTRATRHREQSPIPINDPKDSDFKTTRYELKKMGIQPTPRKRGRKLGSQNAKKTTPKKVGRTTNFSQVLCTGRNRRTRQPTTPASSALARTRRQLVLQATNASPAPVQVVQDDDDVKIIGDAGDVQSKENIEIKKEPLGTPNDQVVPPAHNRLYVIPSCPITIKEYTEEINAGRFQKPLPCYFLNCIVLAEIKKYPILWDRANWIADLKPIYQQVAIEVYNRTGLLIHHYHIGEMYWEIREILRRLVLLCIEHGYSRQQTQTYFEQSDYCRHYEFLRPVVQLCENKLRKE